MRIGVAGVGRWGSKVLLEYLSLEQHQIYFFDPLRSSFADAIPCSSFDDLIKQVDCLHICTPNKLHAELARQALEADVHVLIEKPMTTDSNAAFNLAQLAERKDLILQCGHIFRFAQVIRQAKDLIKDPLWMNFKWSQFMPPIQDTDIIWDLLPHPIDIIHFWTDSFPLDATGEGISVRRNKLFEVASINLIYPDLIASINLSWMTRRRVREIEVICRDFTLIIDPVKQLLFRFEESEPRLIHVRANNTIREEINHFLDSVESGFNDLNSSILGIRNVEAIERVCKRLH